MNNSFVSKSVGELRRLLRTLKEAQVPPEDLIEDLKAELARRLASLSHRERKKELVEEWEDPCAFCGALPSEEHKPECNDVCEQRLSEVGLSDRQLRRGESRELSRPRNEEGESVETPEAREGLSRFFRLPSWRERNWHKKKRARWFKRGDEASDLFQLAVLTAQHGNLLASPPKKVRHAMRSWLRMGLKWGTNQKMEGNRARGLAAIRVNLDRLRKKGKKLEALLRWFAKQPIQVIFKSIMYYAILSLREISLTADHPDSEGYKAAEAMARFAVNIPPQPMTEAMSVIQKTFQEREARLGHKPLVIADPRQLSPEEVRAYWEREARFGEWLLEVASNPFPEPATPEQIQALDEALNKFNNMLKKQPAFDLSALLKYLTRSKSNRSTVQSQDPKDTE